jgi:hypothetical protein
MFVYYHAQHVSSPNSCDEDVRRGSRVAGESYRSRSGITAHDVSRRFRATITSCLWRSGVPHMQPPLVTASRRTCSAPSGQHRGPSSIRRRQTAAITGRRCERRDALAANGSITAVSHGGSWRPHWGAGPGVLRTGGALAWAPRGRGAQCIPLIEPAQGRYVLGKKTEKLDAFAWRPRASVPLDRGNALKMQKR